MFIKATRDGDKRRTALINTNQIVSVERRGRGAGERYVLVMSNNDWYIVTESEDEKRLLSLLKRSGGTTPRPPSDTRREDEAQAFGEFS